MNGLLLLLLLLLLLFLLLLAWPRTEHWVLVPDTTTKRAFPVLPLPDSHRATALLASLSTDIDTLLAHVIKTFPDDARLGRVMRKWHYQKLAEGRFDQPDVTSYTVNKGDRIVLCLRSRTGQLHHKNLIMYVLLHELAHIMSVSMSTVYHNEEFQTNLKWLLEQATELGVYHSNTQQETVNYCGMPDVTIP
jgi:hypothetical protein